MNVGETDLFDEMMGKDVEGVFPALRRFEAPRKSVQRARPGTFANGMAYTYHCPDCGTAARVLVSWAELVVVAAGVRPQAAVGVEDTMWQMDALHPTGFGPATKCRCPNCPQENAPFLIGIEEAKQDLAAAPYHAAHPDVIRVKELLAAYTPEPLSGIDIVFDNGGKVAVPVVRPPLVVTKGRAFGEAPLLDEKEDVASALGMNDPGEGILLDALLFVTKQLSEEKDMNRAARLQRAVEAIEAIDEDRAIVTDRHAVEIRKDLLRETVTHLRHLETTEKKDPS